MGKLTITVHKCHVLRSPGLETVNCRIRIVVDGVYKFHTRSKLNTFRPTFEESFTVGNTNRLAVIEVFAYNCAPYGSAEDERLLGCCRLSIEGLVQGEKRTRQHVIVAKDDTGIIGTIHITLKADIPGDSEPVMTEVVEKKCVKRLTRFFIQCDRSRLADVDLLLASVKGPHALASPPSTPGPVSSFEITTMRDRHATFDDLMENLCATYNSQEPPLYRLAVVVEGCTDLEQRTMYLPSQVVVAIRSASEDFVTPLRPFTANPVWGRPTGLVYFDVIDPSNFVLDIMVYYISPTSKDSEVGRAQVRVSTLTRDHSSARQVFIFKQKDYMMPRITGMVHLTMKPFYFGLVPMKVAEHIDGFYQRLNRFFYRYDRRRIPQIDALINARLDHLDELMKELEIQYGREPGTIELWVTIQELHSLQLDATTNLDEKDVVVLVTMGDHIVRTEPKRVLGLSRTVINQTFIFDVARETDMIKFQVVRSRQENTVYGRVDFTCLKLHRGVRNDRTLYLVGAAGTPNAYISGVLSITLYSEQLGQPFAVDIEAKRMYAGRLWRYVQSRAPDKLHLVNIAVDTVFDMEGFMGDIAREYGEEDATYAVYVTVLGCRQLRTNFWFSMNPYVVVRMGIERYETHVVKNTGEPDFFDFFEFFVDKPRDAHLTLIVMDRCELGTDKEVGRVVIPFDAVELDEQYHEWLPLTNPDDESNGIIGVRFIVKNLNLREMLHGEKQTCTSSPLLDQQQQQQSLQRDMSTTLTDRGRRPNTFRARFDEWRSKLARVTAQFQLREHASNNSSIASTDASSVFTSEQDSSYHVPMNLMDEGIHTVDEFFSVSRGSNVGHVPTTPSHSTEPGLVSDVGSLSLTRPRMHGGKWLHVRLLYCDDLEDRRRVPPDPYVMLSTLNKTHQTKMAFQTRTPRYNEEFTFSITDPSNDFLSITVITETPYGKKCLGHCILSMKNVQRGTPRTRRVSLVVAPHRPVAAQRGTVCLTLLGENFGLDYMPSVDAENRFREMLQKLLASRAPEELHRIEWFIGEYSHKENELVEGIMGKLDSTGDNKKMVAEVIITVKSVTHLYYNDRLVISGSCFVKVKAGGKMRCCTKSVKGANGSFMMQEECHLSVSQPTTEKLRVGVYIDAKGKYKCGECELSLADLHQSVAQERTHFIVKNCGLSTATPVGYVTISLFSSNFGSVVSPSTEDNDAQYTRLRDFYYYHRREQLHAVDVKFSTTFNVEALIQRLTEKYGPEPGNYRLRINVLRCHSLVVKCGSPYCIIKVGLMQYKTSIVQGNGEYVFLEAFDVQIGLPEKEEVQLLVMMVDTESAVGEEVGRTVLPIKSIAHGKETHLKLPLVYRAQTRFASLHGSVEVSLLAYNFGVDSEYQRGGIEENIYERMEREMSRHHPEDMHYLPTIVAEAQEQDEHMNYTTRQELPLHLDTTAGHPIRILLLSLRDFPENEVYIKIKMNDNKTVLRTGNLGGKRLAHINEEFTIDTSYSVEEILLTVKLAVTRFRRSCALCFCDFIIAQCPKGRVITKWLRLFDMKGKPMGQLGVQVDMPAILGGRREARAMPPPHDVESATDDLSSLMMKYNPKDLRRLDVMIGHSDDIRTIHSLYRQQLAPQVQATVYCEVHQTELLNPVKGRRVVEATVKADVVHSVERKLVSHVLSPASQSSNTCHISTGNLNYPPLRIDITTCDALVLRVFGDGSRDEAEVCRAVLSLRALLTPQLYDMGEPITVPLVKVQRQRNTVRAQFAGTVTLSLKSPAFESYPASVLLFDSSRKVNRDFVRYYLDRVCSLLKHYDANSLTDIHQVVYEKCVVKDTWAQELPNLLLALVKRWGPEIEPFSAPPPV
ncbi:hypothetical protein DQ04_00381040 [Trypanosoma grayi]|uniref:hypothetical protein n=1 Tax=Trypanosoma grayi TaxID=71804 RepID=UPI0004F4B286|nr:hypothetical protein DQ04_00381040 [Trypanosoma grayi]KEG14599.1 hypothetical protein DQ04_00381040 [Trypanosoma grayi]